MPEQLLPDAATLWKKNNNNKYKIESHVQIFTVNKVSRSGIDTQCPFHLSFIPYFSSSKVAVIQHHFICFVCAVPLCWCWSLCVCFFFVRVCCSCCCIGYINPHLSTSDNAFDVVILLPISHVRRYCLVILHLFNEAARRKVKNKKNVSDGYSNFSIYVAAYWAAVNTHSNSKSNNKKSNNNNKINKL